MTRLMRSISIHAAMVAVLSCFALFIGAVAAMGVLVLPIMLYHQLQLFVCAVMARRYGARVVQQVV